MARTVLQLNSGRRWIGEVAHTFRLCTGLAGTGWRVILGCREGHELERRARAAGIEVVAMHMESRFSPRRDWADICRIARLVADEGALVLHAHRSKDHWLAGGAKALRGARARLVRTRHVMTPLRAHALNRWLYGRTDRVIAVSAAVGRQYADGRLVDAARLRVIHGAVDVERFRPLDAAERAEVRRDEDTEADAPLVVTVARLAPVKGHALLLRAFAAARRQVPGARLWLIGDGPLEAELRRQIAALALEGAVRLLGRREDVDRLIGAADAAAVASVGSEGFSRAAAEAMACGLAVVGTRVGAVPELIEDGKTGLLVDPHHEAELAAALVRLLGDRERAAEMGAAGRMRAEAEFAELHWVGRNAEIYEELAGAAD